MNLDSPRKTTSGCGHQASRRIVSPKERRLRTSKAMPPLLPVVVAVLKPKRGVLSNGGPPPCGGPGAGGSRSLLDDPLEPLHQQARVVDVVGGDEEGVVLRHHPAHLGPG